MLKQVSISPWGSVRRGSAVGYCLSMVLAATGTCRFDGRILAFATLKPPEAALLGILMAAWSIVFEEKLPLLFPQAKLPVLFKDYRDDIESAVRKWSH